MCTEILRTLNVHCDSDLMQPQTIISWATWNTQLDGTLAPFFSRSHSITPTQTCKHAPHTHTHTHTMCRRPKTKECKEINICDRCYKQNTIGWPILCYNVVWLIVIKCCNKTLSSSLRWYHHHKIFILSETVFIYCVTLSCEFICVITYI